MKTRFAAVAICVIVVCGIAFAQPYQIRVSQNTNLRASHSLESAVLVSARAGTTLQVVGRHNRWFQVERGGRQYWMAGWVNHTRVDERQTRVEEEQTAPAQDINNCCYVNRQCATSQEWEAGYWAYQRDECPANQPATNGTASISPSTERPVDNCCFVNRQCVSYEEWEAGYWAYQRNECPASQPATSGTEAISPPAGQEVDNCCFVNRQCESEREWVDGYHAFLYDSQCVAEPPAVSSASGAQFACQSPASSHAIAIWGPSDFKNRLGCALDLLKRKGGGWYNYTVSALQSIQATGSGGARVYSATGKVLWGSDSSSIRSGDLASIAATLAHEACHVHRHRARLEAGGVEGERACVQIMINALDALHSNHPRRNSLQRLVDTIRDDSDARWWGRD